MNALQVSSIDGGFGVRVQGAALQDLPSHPDAAAQVRELLAQHRAVVLSGLQIDANELLGLAGTLGTVRPARVRHPSLPSPAGDHVFVSVRNAEALASPGAAEDSGHIWHIDYTFLEQLPKLSVLYAVKAPPDGSRSGFADMVKVYAALPSSLKDEVQHLQAIHYSHPRGVDVLPDDTPISVSWEDRQKGLRHPMVMRDDRGLPFLCLPARRDSAIEGLDEAGSRALLDRLWPYVEAHGQPWEYELASGEMLIWDNRALLHKRSNWPLNEERLIWFLTTQ